MRHVSLFILVLLLSLPKWFRGGPVAAGPIRSAPDSMEIKEKIGLIFLSDPTRAPATDCLDFTASKCWNAEDHGTPP